MSKEEHARETSRGGEDQDLRLQDCRIAGLSRVRGVVSDLVGV